jgi:hypothetical protein
VRRADDPDVHVSGNKKGGGFFGFGKPKNANGPPKKSGPPPPKKPPKSGKGFSQTL